MAKILVVGGAGYIGSHMMKALEMNGHDAIALDNLSTGHKDAVRNGDLIQADIADFRKVKAILRNEKFDAAVHLASCIEVSESNINPRKYYSNNVVNSLNLINAMLDNQLTKLVFSSTAAVYGIPD